ncbi:hypothetical protein JI735_11725 [Paenibacillus sonchi]|uniref:Uncharacterized protein n=2 Tax=Paenibacillus sonchi group TaxID=2044880 RepID=A0A974PFK2_9BACL|nr:MULTISPECIES: hypothetical protein [Paenibacillus sonchi group]QQZ63094.1 hypothetical protein JI735_11725 [Paenibacillus sonchi]CQR52138.1 putative membrane protein [Paenibacillus riograndensis SBR5]
MKKRQTPLLAAASILLIIISSLIKPESSMWLGALQTVLLGVGILGCCMAFLRFAKGGKGKKG